MHTQTPIDAVITWVNGNDKSHQVKLSEALAKLGMQQRPIAAEPTRFNECGEINYCLQSLFRFAPWLRNIFIVTDAQIPPIIEQLENTELAAKIKLIDHREIFAGFEDVLPTFNSIAIETMLWRIPKLAEQFIYLNDDCSIIRPVTPDDFFKGNKLVLRGEWKTQTSKKWQNYFYRLKGFLLQKPPKLLTCSEHRTLQENSAKLTGWTKHFFHLPHAPFPMQRSTFAEFFTAFPHLLANNIRHTFRSPKQYWPISLAHHLEIKNNNAIIDNSLKVIAVNGACYSLGKIKQKLKQAERNNVAFICMQSVDLAPKQSQVWMLDWLNNRIITN
ncbi:Capsular polysaccharide phosphotransferase SacB [Legionella beliardensis]|uniref:Capsular polysaccharide phosphotransferase SacB n=1 Tax=Legionella beliardensis TaxID=91822 RepID=A0A378I001_9GAMM|nr:stealth family protein [Legionella beliardensis]STX28081.1 Capsular polysaccharide phosphotransferase SacB [Legionella beliardensis]